MTPAQMVIAGRMSERELQDQVVALAAQFSWLYFHDTDSRRNQAGLPDLIMVRNRRVIFAELKAVRGRLSIAQRAWMAALTAAADHSGGVVGAYLWRPADLLDGTIQAVLR